MAFWDGYISLKPDDPEGYYERAGLILHKGEKLAAKKDLEVTCRLGNKEACNWLSRL